MINLRTLSSVASLSFLSVTAAQAQLSTSLVLNKKQYLAGEPVIATVTITNRAGQDLTFYGDGRKQWLDFIVKDRHGEGATPRGNSGFGTMTIRAGESLQRKVDLAQHFILTEPGSFSAIAVIHMPGNTGEGSSTGRVTFNSSTSPPYYTQKVGIPGKPGQTREFRIISFSGDTSNQIYAQVVDGRTGQFVRTFSLGDVLMLRKPLVTVDRQQRLNVLYLDSPVRWVHCQIDTDGQVVARQYHKRGATGDPQLLTFKDGSVGVSNSIPYDPKAAAEAQAKIRKASDRPPGTF